MISTTDLNLLGPAHNIRARACHHHRKGLNFEFGMTRVPDTSTEIWSEEALVGQMVRATSLRRHPFMMHVARLARSREVYHDLPQIAEHERPSYRFSTREIVLAKPAANG